MYTGRHRRGTGPGGASGCTELFNGLVGVVTRIDREKEAVELRVRSSRCVLCAPPRRYRLG